MVAQTANYIVSSPVGDVLAVGTGFISTKSHVKLEWLGKGAIAQFSVIGAKCKPICKKGQLDWKCSSVLLYIDAVTCFTFAMVIADSTHT